MKTAGLTTLGCPSNPKKSLEIQGEIVRILVTFTELTAREKQYNYYRDQLLSFPKPEEVTAFGQRPYST